MAPRLADGGISYDYSYGSAIYHLFTSDLLPMARAEYLGGLARRFIQAQLLLPMARRLLSYGSAAYFLRLGDPGILRGHEARTEREKGLRHYTFADALWAAQANFSEFCVWSRRVKMSPTHFGFKVREETGQFAPKH